MSDAIKKLRERRLNVWEEAKHLVDAAAEENREFTAEEQGKWDQLNAEIDALDRRQQAMIEGEQRAKDTEEAFAKLEGQPAVRGGGNAGSDRNEALRAWAKGAPGTERHFDVMPPAQVNFRDLLTTTGAAGGDTVPTSFFERLMAHLIETSAILQAGAFVLNTGSGEPLQVPKTTAHSAAAIVTEGTAIPESDPAFAQVVLAAFKYGALIQVSRELVDDTGVDLEGYLSFQAGRALGNALGANAITGTGVGQPRGIITDATTGVTGAGGASGAFTADDLIDLFHSVIPPYRSSAAAGWLLNDQGVAAARKLKLTDGQFIWTPGLQAGDPDTLLGKRVYIDPNVPAPAVDTDSVVFGDISQYFVRFAGGVRFERSDAFAFGSDLVTFRALLRADGALIDLTGAVKKFTGGPVT